MSMAEIFAVSDRAYKARVMASTWGHLAPEQQKVYKGTILFTCGDYGDITPIKCEFKDLEDSPWFFDDMSDFIYEKSKDRQGKVLKFIGTYKKQKNGKGRFSGKILTIIR